MNILTPEFRVSYPSVFKPKLNDLNGKQEYSLQALFDKSANLDALKAACLAAAEKKWGKDQNKWPKTPEGKSAVRMPFRDQADRAKQNPESGKMVLPAGYEAGSKYLNLKSERKPGVVNQRVEAIIDENEFYAGCYARATIQAFAYDQKGNRGVSFGLQNIQKTRDGDPFGNRTKAEDDFSPVSTSEEASGSQGGVSAGGIFD